jgi:predicted  nucleic acid-binding Zn-ribbon protein
MTREERLKADPVWAAEYHRKARERSQKRLANPEVYAEVLRKNRERAAAKRGPKPPAPTDKNCTKCGETYPAASEFFGPRSAGQLKLVSWCRGCAARIARETRADPEKNEKHKAAVKKSFKKRLAADPSLRNRVHETKNAWRRRKRADPEYREKELAKDREWRRANWDRVKKYKHKCGALQVHHVARRHAAKLRATPFWSQTKEIEALYAEARRLTEETGIEHHVDHIVPLRGRNVCGLHVFANLRVITADQNKRKANKLIEELLAA